MKKIILSAFFVTGIIIAGNTNAIAQTKSTPTAIKQEAKAVPVTKITTSNTTTKAPTSTAKTLPAKLDRLPKNEGVPSEKKELKKVTKETIEAKPVTVPKRDKK